MFWSGNKLKDKLEQDQVVYYAKNIDKKPAVDCASIVLTVGPEGYTTPQNPDAEKAVKILDEKNRSLTIPRGQFGFILTEEYVRIPATAMGLISFKASYKFQGLINVSGFHVDPGWHGRLIFSVYNAGPKDIVLDMADAFALIWFVDLDDTATEKYAKDSNKTQNGIPSKLINNITGDVFSPIVLKNDFETFKNEMEKWKIRFVWGWGTAIVGIGLAINRFFL